MQMSSSTPFGASIGFSVNLMGDAGPASATSSTNPSQAQLLMQVVMALVQLIKAQAGQEAQPSLPQAPCPAPSGTPVLVPGTMPGPMPGTMPGTMPGPMCGPMSGPICGPMAGTPSPVKTGRPPGDYRTAEQIMNDPANVTLKKLGHQKDIKRDALTVRLGDLDDADPEKRADAVYNWAGTLNSVKRLKAFDGSDRGDIHTNGKLEGITHDGDARHGTEAAVLKDFAETGVFPTDGQLTTTKDSHVRKNGTNKSNFQWGMEQLGKFVTGALSQVFAVIAEVVSKTLGKLPGIGKFLAAPAEMLAKGISDGMAVANVAISGGDVKAAGREMGLDMLDTVVSSTVGLADPTGVLAGQAGQAARNAADPTGTSSPDALKLSFA